MRSLRGWRLLSSLEKWHADFSFLNGEPFGRPIFLPAFLIYDFDYGSLRTVLWKLFKSDRLRWLEKCFVSSGNLREWWLVAWSYSPCARSSLLQPTPPISRPTVHSPQKKVPNPLGPLFIPLSWWHTFLNFKRIFGVNSPIEMLLSFLTLIYNSFCMSLEYKDTKLMDRRLSSARALRGFYGRLWNEVKGRVLFSARVLSTWRVGLSAVVSRPFNIPASCVIDSESGRKYPITYTERLKHQPYRHPYRIQLYIYNTIILRFLYNS